MSLNISLRRVRTNATPYNTVICLVHVWRLDGSWVRFHARFSFHALLAARLACLFDACEFSHPHRADGRRLARGHIVEDDARDA